MSNNSKFQALLEDEEDIFGGTPESKYWDICNQVDKELVRDEFDGIVERLAILEALISETHDYENLDKIVKSYKATNMTKVEHLKKSVYMELAGQFIYRIGD